MHCTYPDQNFGLRKVRDYNNTWSWLSFSFDLHRMHPQLTQVHIVALKLSHLCGKRLAKRMSLDRVQTSYYSPSRSISACPCQHRGNASLFCDDPIQHYLVSGKDAAGWDRDKCKLYRLWRHSIFQFRSWSQRGDWCSIWVRWARASEYL